MAQSKLDLALQVTGAFDQSALKVKNATTYALSLKPNESLTADRLLNFIVNDTNRTIDLSGNLTVSSAATISGTNTGDQIASQVPNTPSGNISATDVQAAINELDSEKQAALVSGTNIKTVASTSLLGSGNISADFICASQSTGNMTLNKLQGINANTILGNSTGSTATISELSGSTVTSMLSAFTGDSGSGGVKGLVPAPSAGDAAAGKFLKADGTFAVPSAGSFNPTITSPAANDLLVYNSVNSAWENALVPMKDLSTISVTSNVATVTVPTLVFSNISISSYKLQLSTSTSFASPIYDSGYQAGNTFDLNSYVTGGTVYYVRAIIKTDWNNRTTQWLATTSFTAISQTFSNTAVYFWAGPATLNIDPSTHQYNWLNGAQSNNYYPMAMPPAYVSNGQNWTTTQILAVSNQNGASLGSQAIYGNPSYTFTQYDGISSYGPGGETCIVFDLGSTKSCSAFQFKAVSGSTPGGWGGGGYTNGNKIQYWSGSAWVDLYTFSGVTNFQTINGSFSAVSFRYYRLYALSTQYTITCGLRMQG